MEGRPVNVTFSSCVCFVPFSGLLSLCLLFLISGFLLLLSLSVLCFFFFVLHPLSLVLPRSRCRHLSFVILCSAASGSGGWLLKTVKTMANAGSRLCAFVRWAEFASSLLLVLDSVTFSSEMKGQRRWWGCSSSLCRSSTFLSPQFFFAPSLPLSVSPVFHSPLPFVAFSSPRFFSLFSLGSAFFFLFSSSVSWVFSRQFPSVFWVFPLGSAFSFFFLVSSVSLRRNRGTKVCFFFF